MFKCDDCGRFISYADLDEKRAFRKLSAYTQETWETVCAQCIANTLAEDAEIAAEDAEIERLQAALEESLSSPRKEGK